MISKGPKNFETRVADQADLNQVNWLDADESAKVLRSLNWNTSDWDGLYFGKAERQAALQRARTYPKYVTGLQKAAAELTKTSAEEIRPPLATYPAREAATMAEAALVLDRPEFADWARTRILATLREPSWMFYLHKDECTYCDHVMANVGEALSYAQDLLQLPHEDRKVIARELRRLLIDPFLQASRTRVENWTKAEIATNWKIMTCGDTGSAVCAFAEFYEDTPELMAMAIRGVMETLDAVPPEGDWYEGPSYWFGTLNFGLRMLLATKRRTSGTLDFFWHPVLKTTGDFALHMITPGGRYYAWNDNFARLEHVDETLKGKGNAGSGKALTILARMADRQDWRYLTTKFPNKDLFVLALAEPDKPQQIPTGKVGWFPHSGVLTMRTGWNKDDAFVGIRCGRVLPWGHSHLDTGSFIIEAAGEPLLVDSGCWKYGPDFFDSKRRWDYDANATRGHNCLLIDGRGVERDESQSPEVVRQEHFDGRHVVEMNLAPAYSDRATSLIRTLVFLEPDMVVIRDRIRLKRPLYVEWLANYTGKIMDRDEETIIHNNGASLRLKQLLPTSREGWRISDVRRQSFYTSYDNNEKEDPEICHRSFGPMHEVDDLDLVFVMRFGADASGDWPALVSDATGNWRLLFPDSGIQVQTLNDSLKIQQNIPSSTVN